MNDNPDQAREALLKSVTTAVGALFEKRGIDPAVVFEGAIRGGAAALIAAGATPKDVADVLTEFASAFSELEQSKTMQ